MSATRAAAMAPARAADVEATIVALATPAGPGARAILRLSGPELADVLRRSFPAAAFDPRRRSVLSAELGLPSLSFPVPARLVWWPGPRSFTGQDVAEIHTLGSPPLVQALMDRLVACGARLARPGEFTLRAWLAGKLDLSQAEAIHDLIHADDPAAARAAFAQLSGGLASPTAAVRDELLLVLAEVEAGLDFAEEDLSLLSAAEMARRLRAAERRLAELAERQSGRGRSDRPPRVVLAGRPNAGKSSLFNALAGSPLALVSPEAGATRDYVAVRLNCAGAELELIDAAGENSASENAADASQIDSQAQALRRQVYREADLILLCQTAEDVHAAPVELPAGVPVLPLWTKADLAPPELPGQALRTSAQRGDGIEELKRRIAAELAEIAGPPPRLSQSRALLEECRSRAAAAARLIEAGEHPELAALELRLALEALGPLVGAVGTEDLLDLVFSQFCIGK